MGKGIWKIPTTLSLFCILSLSAEEEQKPAAANPTDQTVKEAAPPATNQTNTGNKKQEEIGHKLIKVEPSRSPHGEHGRHSTNNSFGPIISIDITSPVYGNYLGFSGLAEFGDKMWRGSGTMGLRLSENAWYKISGEYLDEKLGFSFANGNHKHWVNQWAAGVSFITFLDCCWCLETLEFNATYSHSKKQHLRPGFCAGNNKEFERGIAGSNAGSVEAGTSFAIWPRGYFYVDAIYDAVRFDRELEGRKSIHGPGVRFTLEQAFVRNIDLALTVELRRPFNSYEAALTWSKEICGGIFGLGGWVNYSRGKDSLPNVTAAGFELTYLFDCQSLRSCQTESREPCDPSCGLAADYFIDWISAPAVYRPFVISISDEGELVPVVVQ